jgi:hypothetical protein
LFNSTVLDVAVGLIFTFLAVSLAASTVTEAWATALQWRSKTLLQGIQNLLNDQAFTGLAQAIYRNALVSPLDDGTLKTAKQILASKPPSYVDPTHFAQALMHEINIVGADMSPQAIKQRIQNAVGNEQLRTLLTGIVDLGGVAGVAAIAAVRAQIEAQVPAGPVRDALTNVVDRVSDPAHPLDVAAIQADVPPGPVGNAIVALANLIQNNPGALQPDAIRQLIQGIGDPQIKALLNSIINNFGSDIDKIRTEIAKWFDQSMDRVSGIYKRWTQLWNFAIALLLAAGLNVSAIHVAKTLWVQPLVTKNVEKITDSMEVKENAKNALDALADLALPIGWAHYNQAPNTWPSGWDWPEMVLGWVITAFATLFGAPFWFDMLQQFVRLKGSGPSPQEKRSGSAAEA